MTIIVTGGAGFIGSNFVFYELKNHPEDRIVCIDKLTYAGNLSTLAPVMEKPNFRFVRMDICDREGIYKLFEEEKPDIVVNFAAESHVDRSIEDPGIFLKTNILLPQPATKRTITIYFLATPCDLQDLSFQTRYRTPAPSIGSVES